MDVGGVEERKGPGEVLVGAMVALLELNVNVFVLGGGVVGVCVGGHSWKKVVTFRNPPLFGRNSEKYSTFVEPGGQQVELCTPSSGLSPPQSRGRNHPSPRLDRCPEEIGFIDA